MATKQDLVLALADLTDAFLSRHGCFPLDEVTPEQRQWKSAMARAYELVGQPDTIERRTALAKVDIWP